MTSHTHTPLIQTKVQQGHKERRQNYYKIMLDHKKKMITQTTLDQFLLEEEGDMSEVEYTSEGGHG